MARLTAHAETALDNAKRAIADAVLGHGSLPAEALGTVTLRGDQRQAAARLLGLIERHGGAMLAERVGVGKTYVALAVARRFPSTLVVAPAGLRAMWAESAQRAGVSVSFASYESLSRGRFPPESPAFVIFDESHRLRNSATRRYTLAAEIARRAAVLLLSATPVQNRPSDLMAQLALFAGSAAWAMSDEQRAHYILRSWPSTVGSLPRSEGPYELALPDDDVTTDRLVSLPAPVPAADEGVATALVTCGLLHQWTSSRAALLASLKRRMARATGLLSTINAGRYPTRAELASWAGCDDVVQLAFPEIVLFRAPPNVGRGLAAQIEDHRRALEDIVQHLSRVPSIDVERVRLLREIRSAHSGERVIAFAQYSETVSGLFRLLVHDGHVASLTARGARVASGRMSRHEIIAQFRPAAANVPEHLRIDLLLTTDVLSEGLNLQEASVVVHLDLPWNPARLEQRVGRVRRLGSRYPRIVTYLMQATGAAERLLELENRLRTKLRTADRTIGVAGRILPLRQVDSAHAAPSIVESLWSVDAVLRTWQADANNQATSFPPIAAVESDAAGFLAAIRNNDGGRLIANLGLGVSTDPQSLVRALKLGQGRATPCDAKLLADARVVIHEWIMTERARDAIDLRATVVAPMRRQALARVNRALARAPRHRRAAIVPLVAAARAIATAPLPEAAERLLESLVESDLQDEAWLRLVIAFGELNARRVESSDPESPPELIAVIIFQTSRLGGCV